MPAGIPVATVAIDGAANAALLAIEILSVYDDELFNKLSVYRSEATDKVLLKNSEIEKKYNN
jgi:5-(carboxyamino)imidazole ribonucleotide mutase